MVRELRSCKMHGIAKKRKRKSKKGSYRRLATPLSYKVTRTGWKQAQLAVYLWLVILMDRIVFQQQNKKLVGRDLSHFSGVRKKVQWSSKRRKKNPIGRFLRPRPVFYGL